MRKFVATLLLLFVFQFSSFAQVVIDKESRIENRNPGYCVWCCLETLGNHQQIAALKGLVDSRDKEFIWEWNAQKKVWKKSPYVWIDYGTYQIKEHRSPGTARAISNKLDNLGVKYRYQNYYNYDKTLIKNAVKNKQACLIVVRWWKGVPCPDTHAIILLDYNEKGIEFLDPNEIDNTYTASHQWFNHYWTGYVLVIDR